MPVTEKIRSIESRFPWSFSGFILAIIFGLLSIYLGFFKNNSPDLNYLITSSSGVLDVKEELGNLDVLYKGKSLSSSEQDLQVISFKVINQGNSTIVNNSYDKDFPIGFVLENGLLADTPKIISTSNDYIKGKLNIKTVDNNKVLFSNVIIEPNAFFELKILILYKVGMKPDIKSIGKIADVDKIDIFNDYNKVTERSFLDRIFIENITVQFIRIIAYGFLFFFCIMLIVITQEKIEYSKKRKRKKVLLNIFKNYKSSNLSRKDELFFETYLSNGLKGLKLISGLVNDHELINEISTTLENEGETEHLNSSEILKTQELIQEEIVTLENGIVKIDLQRISVLTDLIQFLERQGEDTKSVYRTSRYTDANMIEDFSKEMSSLKSDQLKLQGAVAIHEKNFPKAMEYFEEYLEHFPKDPTALWKLAYAKKHTGDIIKALDLIETALEYSDKPSYLLHYNYACYLSLNNKPIDKVIEQLEISLNLDPSGNVKSAMTTDSDLKNVNDKIEFTRLKEKYIIPTDLEEE